MSSTSNVETRQYFCPFCSKEIMPEDVLFADEDKLSRRIPESDYDPQRAKDFSSRVLTMNSVQTPEGPIEMEERPLYKYHHWCRPKGDLPYREPLSVSKSDSKPFPDSIHVYRRNGLTPKQLTGDDPAPWDVVIKTEDEASKEPEKKQSMAARLLEQMRSSETKETAADNDNSAYEDESWTISQKACPHCHCLLPESFSELPAYRIAMLGGTRSGKTTYMVAAANLLKQQLGLPTGVISSCIICEESARYFDFLIRCMEYNHLAATVLDESTVIRFVFPIVMNVAALDESGNEQEFILIISDIPGEAMKDKTFMVNYPGLCHADAAIMLMDPMQFISAAQQKKNLAESDLRMVNPNGVITEEDIVNYTYESFTPDPFGTTLTNVKKMITESTFVNLSCFVLVLNKLDLLYAGWPDQSIINSDVARNLNRIHGRFHLNDISPEDPQHDGGMDLELIGELSNQVSYLIRDRLKYPAYESTIKPVADIVGEIMTLCTSVRVWNTMDEKFCRPADEQGKAGAETIIGFRLLEPLLYALAKLQLVRTKEHVEVQQPEEPKRRWWEKLFGKM